MNNFKILNSKKVKLLILMSLVLVLTLGVYLNRGREVALEVDGNKTNTVTYSKTVEEFLQEEDVDFRKGAVVNLPLDTEIEDNLNIIIINPKTYILKDKYGVNEVNSIHETVGEVLTDLDIKLDHLNYTKPAIGERLEEGATIELITVKEEVVVEESKIEFEKIEEKTTTLYKGQSKLKQKGVEGLKETHTQNRYEDDILVKSEIVKEEIVREAKDHIVLVGTKSKPVYKSPTFTQTPNRGGSISGRSMIMNASAYDLSYASTGKRPGDKGYGITASGMKAGPGVVAVDPRVIPLGTRLYIEGYGNAIAGDTGSAIKGNKIDLFYSSRSAAMRFGRRNVRVTILK